MLRRYSKYELYEASVQDSQAELDLFQRAYTNAFGKKATILREDFCSTFLNSITWVKSKKDRIAYAVDMNPKPLAYGREVHYSKLNQDQKKRMITFCENVLSVRTPKADIISISNFSICFLKERDQMLQYFKRCHQSLKSKGAVVFDMLGGEDLPMPEEDSTPFKLPDGTKAKYFWEHATYNPINNHATFYIHYQIKGQKKQKRVFSYDWRMWSLPELKDLLIEAGFSEVEMYWEGDEKRGSSGNGIFRKTKKAESCPIWIAYIAGIKK